MSPDNGLQEQLVPDQRAVSDKATCPEAADGAIALNGCGRKTEGQDGGWPAYRVLLAVTVISAVPLGIILSYGVFNAHYQDIYSSADDAVWIGVVSNGITFLLMPPLIYVYTTVCRRQPLIHFVWIGWLVTGISLLGAAFSTTINALVVTQGLLLGLGVLLCESPMLQILNTWFVSKRGLAYGIYWGAGDTLAVGISFLADYLLGSLGTRPTFLIFCGFRLPAAPPPVTVARCSVAFFKHPLFYLLLSASLFHALCFYIPQIYLSTFAIEILALPAYSRPLLTALQNVAAIVGQLSFGWLSDITSLHILVITSSGTCAVAAITLWGCTSLTGTPSSQLAILCIFAIVFGVLSSGMMSLWARMGLCFSSSQQQAGPDDIVDHTQPEDEQHNNKHSVPATSQVNSDCSQLVFGWLNASRGLGILVSGPLSKALLNGHQDRPVSTNSATFGAGRHWQRVVIFVACMMAASAIAGLAAWAIDRRERRGRPRKR
ncbi:uncharacterized protein AB675_307 [Cyphellophora attinorum]|uniref:MFS general substrate transporter n=1 Tax=Cyphellophora attinorum TaxID=1664694 RepID=A0A0N1P2R1_9EURO|nr:uncharacterized protein AB675_307 [Phialophora attinorum]KPI46023.1 hypothetical protein AB675_307 [Phialophora attinorum]